MKLLCIADTHGQLDAAEIKGIDCDLCIMLGDHSIGDAYKVLCEYPRERIRGIIGNHDIMTSKGNYLTYFDIPHLTYETVNGKRLLGVDGSIKYKDGYGKPYMWTQEEYAEYMAAAPVSDLLLTHTNSFHFFDDFSDPPKHPAHVGIKAFSDYCNKNKIKLHIHGHNHINGEVLYPNGTLEICVYGVRMIEV